MWFKEVESNLNHKLAKETKTQRLTNYIFVMQNMRRKIYALHLTNKIYIYIQKYLCIQEKRKIREILAQRSHLKQAKFAHLIKNLSYLQDVDIR